MAGHSPEKTYQADLMSNNKGRSYKVDLTGNRTIRDQPLLQVESYKYLGITLDSRLTMKAHINQVIKNVAYRSYTMSKVAKFLPSSLLLTMYKTYILPILDQGDTLFMHKDQDLLNKMQRQQNRCLKMLSLEPQPCTSTKRLRSHY